MSVRVQVRGTSRRRNPTTPIATSATATTIKMTTPEASRRIVEYAFEYAKAYGRKKVTCFTKDNIMKMTDGIFHQVFEEVGAGYPEIEKEHWIVDIGAAKMANKPENFDVVLLPNLYGDILSDVAAEIAGSVGLAGCATYADEFAGVNSRLDQLDTRVQNAAQSAESANQSAQQANQRLDQVESRIQQLEAAPGRTPRG